MDNETEMSGAAARKEKALQRQAEALRLRRGGLTFDLIAQQLNYANASSAQKAYLAAHRQIVFSDVEQVRKEEIDRLDLAQAAIWNGVLQGNNDSIASLIRIMGRRARLLGLDMPVKTQVEVSYYESDTIDAEVRKLAALLDGGPKKELDSQLSQTGTSTEPE